MGTPKAFIRLHGAPLIEHVVNRLRPVFGELHIVGRDIEMYSHLGVPVIQDVGPNRGPLMGLYSGLLQSGKEWCFVVGCDMPFLSAAVIDRMSAFLDDSCHVVAATLKGQVQPLHAFYSRRCTSTARHLLDLETTSLKALIDGSRAFVVPEEELAKVEPGLMSFRDLDTPDHVASLDRDYGQGPDE